MDNKVLFAGSAGLVIVLIVIAALIVVPFLNARGIGQKCVGVVEINGELVAQGVEPTLFFGGIMGSEDIAKLIEEADEEDGVGAIMLVINSPGGSVVATHEVYEAVVNAKKPTVAYFREMAASGGYYIGAGTDYIVSEPSALTGNIGARMTYLEMSGLFEKIGLNETSIAEGKFKNIGNPARKASDEEIGIMQGIVQEEYAEFKKAVIEGRKGKINENEEKIFDSRILTGRQAYSLGLVDKLGGKETAVEEAGRLAGIEGKPKVCKIEKKEKGWLGGVLSESAVFGGFVEAVSQGITAKIRGEGFRVNV